MTFPKARLAVSACLLVAWLSYLGFLVYETHNVVVLSKPQFMVAQAYVVVEIPIGDRLTEEVTIEKVLWPANAAGQLAAGQKVRLPELADFKKENGYLGPGRYLVPLIQATPPYLIAPVPRVLAQGAAPIAVIYSWNPETEAQLKPFIDAKR